MGRNPVFKGIIFILAVAALWHSALALIDLRTFFSLNSPTETAAIQWSAKELSSDHYVPHANYSFEISQKKYSGEYTLSNNRFRNAATLEAELPKYNKREWIVWYNSTDPNISSLEKKFPLKACVYAAVLIGLLLYFIGMQIYIKKGNPQWKWK